MIIPLSKQFRIRGTEHQWQREIRLDPAKGLNEALQAINKIGGRYSKLLDDTIASREAT